MFSLVLKYFLLWPFSSFGNSDLKCPGFLHLLQIMKLLSLSFFSLGILLEEFFYLEPPLLVVWQRDLALGAT